MTSKRRRKDPTADRSQSTLDNFFSNPASRSPHRNPDDPPPLPPVVGVPLDPPSQIPTPRILSWNSNGLSAYARLGVQSITRRTKLVKWLVRMSRKYDFILLQETKLLPLEEDYLRKELPDCWFQYDNNPRGRGDSGTLSAGTLIVVTPSGLANHSPSDLSLPEELAGHGSAVVMKAKGPGYKDFLVCNAYFYGGSLDKVATQKRQLRAWFSVPRVDFIFFLGDFNFPPPSCPPGHAPVIRDDSSREEIWARLCYELGLVEAAQPNPSYFNLTHSPPIATRIDRGYHSFSEGAMAVFDPIATILERPWMGLGPSPRPALLRDHSPLSLVFLSTAPPKRRAFPRTPDYVFKDPDFKVRFSERWSRIKDSFASSLVRWSNFKATLVQVAEEIREESSQRRVSTTLGKVGLLVRIIRILNGKGEGGIEEASSLCRLLGVEPPLAADTAPFLRILDSLFEKEGEVEPPGGAEPVLNMTPRGRGSSFVEEIKVFLPSSRKRIHGLRARAGEELVEDPSQMGALIDSYYGDLWSEGQVPSNRKIQRFLRRYNKRLDPSLIVEPTRETFKRGILGSNNTTTGPDGVPFVAFREIVEEASEEFYLLFVHLKGGGRSPKKFNLGLLFLILKKMTMLVGDTRPITVNNADNRILAAVVKMSLMPAFIQLIEGAQKGFLPGRKMTDHVEEINECFYSALSKKQQMFILFLDTRKAFDSIHHVFLFAFLRHVGLPEDWVLLIVELFREVKASPVLANSRELWIWVFRGVKQGCPLSPLLFVMCYDPLIVFIQRTSTGFLVVLAAADDLAVLARVFVHLWPVMRIIDSFSEVSGLGINYDKTALMPSLPSDFEPSAVLRSPWPAIVVADRYTHLGVLIGPEVTPEEIFRKAHEEATGRVASYGQVVRKLPVHKRNRVLNVFVLPKYLYLGQFFLVPYAYCKRFSYACFKLVVPFKAFGMSFLYSQKSDLGFDPPLINLWASNLATLASNYDLGELDRDSLREAFWRKRPWIYRDSCRISDHRRMAALEFVQRWSDHPRDVDDSFLPAFPFVEGCLSEKRKVYSMIVERAFGAGARTDLSRKLANRGVEGAGATGNLLANFGKLPTKVPAYIRTIFLLFLFKGISTSTRVRHFTRGSVEKNKDNFPCPFCSLGVDDFSHFLTDCPPIGEASQGLFSLDALSPLLSTLSRAPLQVFTLAVPLEPASAQAVVISIVCFVAGVYFARKRATAGDQLAAHTDRILVHVNAMINVCSPKRKGRKSKAVRNFLRLFDSIDPQTIVAFTDGSSLGNPGPSGAGAIVYVPGGGTFYLLAPLGISTNNVAELFAIGMLLLFLQDFGLEKRTVFLCSDSELCLGSLKLGWSVDLGHPDLYASVERLEKASRKQVQFAKVPAHADVEGNEGADFQAKRAASISRRLDMGPFVFTGLSYRQSSFIPPFGGASH